MENINKRPNLKDVARLANVSIATVSRVLNQNYYVSPDVVQRVHQAIQELSYVPNSIARSLKVNETKTIGFVVSDISNTYHVAIAKAVEDVIQQDGYNLIVCSTENQQERELSYLKLLLSKNIDGLLLNSTAKNNDFISQLNLPIILINRKLDIPNFSGDIADTDNFQGAYLLTKYLLSKGHRSIFVVNGPLHLSNAQERFDGFCAAMKEADIYINDSYPFRYEGDFTLQSGMDAMRHLCSLPQKPTAVLALNNMMSIGALKYLNSKNIFAPADISIASYDAIENLELMHTRPTTVNFDPHTIGTCVGKAILERIKKPTIKNRQYVFAPNMILGNAVDAPSDSLNTREDLK